MKLTRSLKFAPNSIFGSNRRGHVFAAGLVALAVFSIAIADLTHLLKDGYLGRYGVMDLLLGKPERFT
ncbi:MAG: hypothetical protein AAFW75_31125 [Cyanobacteria bacterium J06636_16]